MSNNIELVYGFVFFIMLLLTLYEMGKIVVDAYRRSKPFPFEYDDDPCKQLYKTYVKITAINLQAQTFTFMIPGWYKNLEITLSLWMMPMKLQAYLVPDQQYYVWTNLGASDVQDLWFERWEEKKEGNVYGD